MTVTAKNIKVDAKMKHIKVKILDDVIIEGELHEKIQVDELVWTVETSSSSKTLDINLVKWPK